MFAICLASMSVNQIMEFLLHFLKLAMFTVKPLGIGATVPAQHWDIDFLVEIYCENMRDNVPEKGGTIKKEEILKPDKYCGEILLNINYFK